MEKVRELVAEIKQNLSQTSSSQKDEARVMRAMLNDREYEVGLYTKEGKEGTYCPAKDIRGMISSVLSSAAKVPQAEAEKLIEAYEFKKSDAVTMVDVSKEFVNTFLQSGRKLPLGGREKSNVSLSLKPIDAHITTYPKQIGVDSNSKAIYGKAEAKVNAYEGVKVYSPCPSWVE